MFSVAIPTYNPDEKYLRHVLGSVVSQMEKVSEVRVVDDASPAVDVSALISKLFPNEVECEVSKVNRRLAGNWNRCIELARGEWIHILHQDDSVKPGFYNAME